MTLIAIALTFGSGATDVASFTRLGGVFTSVMTGNIVFFGLAVSKLLFQLPRRVEAGVAGANHQDRPHVVLCSLGLIN